MSSITIDDTDPSIQFDNEWSQAFNDKAFMGSSMNTDTNGASAIVLFKGTSIQVFGTIKDGTSSSYSVDGSSPKPFNGFLDAPPYKQFRQLFYASPELPDGDHTLVITNMSDDFPLILDFMVIKSAPPPLPISVTTTKVFTEVTSGDKSVSTHKIVSMSKAVSTGTATSLKVSSSRSTPAITFPTVHAYPTAIPPTIPTSSSSATDNTTLPPPMPTPKPHDNRLSTAAIIGLALGSFAGIASLLLLVYLGYRRKKQRYLTKPRPLPHTYSPTHPSPTQPFPESSTSNHSPPPLSEKSQLYTLENMQDSVSAQVGDLVSDSDGRTDTVYSPQPGTQSEGGQDPMTVLSPLRYTETQTLAPGPSSNLTDSDTPTSPESNVATASTRMSLLPLQDRVFTPFSEPESPLEAVPVNAGGGSSMGKSSAMVLHNLNSLHQRTTSLSVSERNVVIYGGGSGRGAESRSLFDELPPYPGTARWSRKSDV